MQGGTFCFTAVFGLFLDTLGNKTTGLVAENTMEPSCKRPQDVCLNEVRLTEVNDLKLFSLAARSFQPIKDCVMKRLNTCHFNCVCLRAEETMRGNKSLVASFLPW